MIPSWQCPADNWKKTECIFESHLEAKPWYEWDCQEREKKNFFKGIELCGTPISRQQKDIENVIFLQSQNEGICRKMGVINSNKCKDELKNRFKKIY